MTENVTVTKVINKVQVGADGPQGPTGPTGATGATGASGVISVTAPITNSGTSTSAVIGINAGVANGVATLDSDGKVPQSQIPAVAITNTFVVASQAAMLALTAQEGDVAVRTDLNKTYILVTTPASTLGNWQELLTPTDAVSSVDGRTGTVTLNDLYAAKTHASTHASGGTDPVTLAQSQVTNLTTDLAAKAPLASPTFTGTLTTPIAVVTGSTVPANGMYLPTTNTLGLATNSTSRIQINSTGEVAIGGTPIAGRSVDLTKNLTGGTAVYSVFSSGQIQSDATNTGQYFRVTSSTANTNFNMNDVRGYSYTQGAFNNVTAGGTVTNQYGFIVAAGMTSATNNFGFYGSLAAGTNVWNFAAAGTAANYFAGAVAVGSSSLILGSGGVAQQFGVVSTAATNIGAVIRGSAAATGDLTQWQNSAGTVLAKIAASGNIVAGNMAIATSSVSTIHISNGTIPSANPVGGGVLYVESGALKYRGSSGTVTTLGAA